MPEERAAASEVVAKREIGSTEMGRGLVRSLAIGFVAVIFGVPLVDMVAALTRPRSGATPARWELAGRAAMLVQAVVPSPGGSGHGLVASIRAKNAAIRQAISDVESSLEAGSVVGGWVLTKAQTVLIGALGLGNDEVCRGRDGWLFYRPAVDTLTMRGFLDPDWLVPPGERPGRVVAQRHRDPRPAILQFHEQLAVRGITLVLLPVPVKPAIYPERLGAAAAVQAPLHNASFAPLVAGLRDAGVLLFDPAPALVDEKNRGAEPLYLATDTHWRPRAVEVVAERLAAFIRDTVELPEVADPGFTLETAGVSNLGDLAAMLRFPAGQKVFTKESAELHQVITSDDLLWRLDRDADVLVLGDSFTNIYSLGAMGWGEAAGLAEHLSYALGRPLDVIVRNDAAAYATRAMLAQELSRGRDRLAGKRLVVWEFTERELSFGDWRPLSMDLAPAPKRTIWTPARGASAVVSGTILDMGVVPRPGGAPYADHVAALHLGDLESTEADVRGREAVVFVRTMVDYTLTPAAGWRVGQRVTLRVRPWAEAGDEIQSMMRSELADEALMFAEPSWGEEVVR